MISQNKLRLILFTAVAGLHGILIFSLAFHTGGAMGTAPAEQARVMKLTDIEEEAPPPPPPSPDRVPENAVEAIAETMIETDVVPANQTVVAAGTLLTPQSTEEDYLPMHLISVRPEFDERQLAQALVYPPIARRSGIEGRVILELFVDRTGRVQQITVLQETPPGRGFAEAAVKAFEGQRGTPGQANGRPVSVRLRWPVRFVLRD